MAYTSVIPVRRLDRTVDYVQNKEKTTPKSLEEAVDYAANRDKTESACFETGLGCTTTSAFEDMRLNTLRWHKETGVQGCRTNPHELGLRAQSCPHPRRGLVQPLVLAQRKGR